MPGKVVRVARRNLDLPTHGRSGETIDGRAVPETSRGATKACEQTRRATGRKWEGWVLHPSQSTRDFMDHRKPGSEGGSRTSVPPTSFDYSKAGALKALLLLGVVVGGGVLPA